MKFLLKIYILQEFSFSVVVQGSSEEHMALPLICLVQEYHAKPSVHQVQVNPSLVHWSQETPMRHKEESNVGVQLPAHRVHLVFRPLTGSAS